MSDLITRLENIRDLEDDEYYSEIAAKALDRISALEKVAEAAVEAWEADQIGRKEPYDEKLSGALDDLEQPLRAAGYLKEQRDE